MILRKLLGNLMRKSHGWFIKEMDDLRKPNDYLHDLGHLHINWGS